MKEVIRLDEIVDVKDRSRERSILSHCIFHTLGNMPVNDDALNEEIRENKELTVEMTINGRPVSLRSFLMEFERQHEWMLAKKAEEVFKERMNGVMNTLYDIERVAKDKFREAFGQDLDD